MRPTRAASRCGKKAANRRKKLRSVERAGTKNQTTVCNPLDKRTQSHKTDSTEPIVSTISAAVGVNETKQMRSEKHIHQRSRWMCFS